MCVLRKPSQILVQVYFSHPRRMRATSVKMNLDIIANFSKQSDPLQQKAVSDLMKVF